MERRAVESYVVVGVRLIAAVMLAVFAILIEPVMAGAVEADEVTVVINEVMWDGDEYIELYNASDAEVMLDGWVLTRQQLDKEAKIIVEFEEGEVMEAGDYYLIEKKEEATEAAADLVVSLTLINSGERLTLTDSEGKIVDQANSLEAEGWYAGENTDTGAAMERTDAELDGSQAEAWHTSTRFEGGRYGTPGAENSEPAVNAAPEAVITGATTALVGEEVTFSGADSIDEDGDELGFVWLFGDGDSGRGIEVAHEYKKSGSFKVVLTVSDEELEDEAEWEIKIEEPVYSDKVVINEFLPNPVGSDTSAEFIELKNTGNEMVDLNGWQLDDKEGGSKAYIIDDGIEISGGGILAFSRKETRLALNNGGDEVRLMNPAGETVSSFVYNESAVEGQSYNREGGGYALSTQVTEGEENVIVDPGEKAEEEEEDGEENIKGEVLGASIKEIELKDIRDEEVGVEIKTMGVVSVPPGVFGNNYLYLAGSGAQVYFSKGDYPELKLGDVVEIMGVISSARGETRIKLARAADISKVKNGEPPQPHVIESGEVDEAVEGWLVTVQGEVTATSGSTFYIDDGSGEVKIYIKPTTSIKKPKMKKGNKVTITGVVSETSSGYRVLPRFQEDVRLGMVAGLTSFPVTGLSSESSSRIAGGRDGWRMISIGLGLVVMLMIMARENREPLLVMGARTHS